MCALCNILYLKDATQNSSNISAIFLFVWLFTTGWKYNLVKSFCVFCFFVFWIFSFVWKESIDILLNLNNDIKIYYWLNDCRIKWNLRKKIKNYFEKKKTIKYRWIHIVSCMYSFIINTRFKIIEFLC